MTHHKGGPVANRTRSAVMWVIDLHRRRTVVVRMSLRAAVGLDGADPEHAGGVAVGDEAAGGADGGLEAPMAGTGRSRRCKVWVLRCILRIRWL